MARNTLIDLFLRKGLARHDLNDHGHHFTQTFVGESDGSDILDVRVSMEKVLNLHRKDIFTATDDQVFFPIDQKNKPVFVLLCHIPRV